MIMDDNEVILDAETTTVSSYGDDNDDHDENDDMYNDSISSSTTTYYRIDIQNRIHDLIQPFLSNFICRSLVVAHEQQQHHHHHHYRYTSSTTDRTARSSTNNCRSYNGFGAVLLIQLSSNIHDDIPITASANPHKQHREGTHVVVSNALNTYYKRIVQVIDTYGGDIIQITSDSILVVWDGTEKQISIVSLCAAKCALELQQNIGICTFPELNLEFKKIRCGLCIGKLQLDIFVALQHAHMQRLFHWVHGNVIREVSNLMNLSKADGETVISSTCCDTLQGRVTIGAVEGYDGNMNLLLDVNMEETMEIALVEHIDSIQRDRRNSRNHEMKQEEFIHPTLLRQLTMDGSGKPTQISQIRNLCVLFIAMTSKSKPINWLVDVQRILDHRHCPIIRINDDDKGLYIVAVLNYYEAETRRSSLGVQICRDLVDQQIGCAIGMAMGETFGGVIGSASVACRLDITGSCVRRAAQLMQYAKTKQSSHRTKVAIDQSMYDDPLISSQLILQDKGIQIKGGSLDLVNVYTLSDSPIDSVVQSPMVEAVYSHVHDDIVEKLHKVITISNSPCNCAIITGLPLAGKKVVCQRAAQKAKIDIFIHHCDPSGGLLQLAQTIALCFNKSSKATSNVHVMAQGVLQHMGKQRWNCALEECIDLVNKAMEEGLRCCFLVDQIHFLDDFSLSLIRECLQISDHVNNPQQLLGKDRDESSQSNTIDGKSNSMISFLCTHVSLYNHVSIDDMVEDIVPDGHDIPVFQVTEATSEELLTVLQEACDIVVDDRVLDTHGQASGHCIGYFIQRVRAIQNISMQLLKEGNRPYLETTKERVLTIPPGFIRTNRILPVTQISVDCAMRYYQIYDDLPPLLQALVRVLSIGTCSGLYKLPQDIMWQTLKIIVHGVTEEELDAVLHEMKDMFLINIEIDDGIQVISFRCPPLADVAHEVCTPDQIRRIGNALIEKLLPLAQTSLCVNLVLANIYKRLDNQEETTNKYWLQAYHLLQQDVLLMTRARDIDGHGMVANRIPTIMSKDKSKDSLMRHVDKWKELIIGETIYAGCNQQLIVDHDVDLFRKLKFEGEDNCFNLTSTDIEAKIGAVDEEAADVSSHTETSATDSDNRLNDLDLSKRRLLELSSDVMKKVKGDKKSSSSA